MLLALEESKLTDLSYPVKVSLMYLPTNWLSDCKVCVSSILCIPHVVRSINIMFIPYVTWNFSVPSFHSTIPSISIPVISTGFQVNPIPSSPWMWVGPLLTSYSSNPQLLVLELSISRLTRAVAARVSWMHWTFAFYPQNKRTKTSWLRSLQPENSAKSIANSDRSRFNPRHETRTLQHNCSKPAKTTIYWLMLRWFWECIEEPFLLLT